MPIGETATPGIAQYVLLFPGVEGEKTGLTLLIMVTEVVTWTPKLLVAINVITLVPKLEDVGVQQKFLVPGLVPVWVLNVAPTGSPTAVMATVEAAPPDVAVFDAITGKHTAGSPGETL